MRVICGSGMPVTPEVFKYDADGNLTNDGRWVITWVGLDAPSSTQPATSRQSLRFKYDHQGRRISKTVSNYTGSAWSLLYSTKFVYDGWNLLAEINAANNKVLRTYIWGIDASGTAQGAGGVGGLLAIRDSSGSATTNCFLAYDGNYNVRALTDSKTGASAGEYEYDPFGNVLRTTGASAQSNPIRFSTKFQDQESGWSHYGYRYLANGRWLNRDPIAEQGGLGIYAYVQNDPIAQFDALGLDFTTIPFPFPGKRPPKPPKRNPPPPTSSLGLYVCCRTVRADPKDDCLTKKCGKFFTHCDISGKCGSGEDSYPVEKDPSATMDNGTPMSQATPTDIADCLKRNPYRAGGWYPDNCQSNTRQRLTACGLSSTWNPDIYAYPPSVPEGWPPGE